MMFQTTFQVAAASIKLGDKVTLHTDGLQVTATTTGGVAEVVQMDGTTAGSPVLRPVPRRRCGCRVRRRWRRLKSP